MTDMARRGFWFDSGPIEDDPVVILKAVEECLEGMAQYDQAQVFYRRPLKVEREKLFDQDKVMARVTCRLALIKPAMPHAEPPLYGFGYEA